MGVEGWVHTQRIGKKHEDTDQSLFKVQKMTAKMSPKVHDILCKMFSNHKLRRTIRGG